MLKLTVSRCGLPEIIRLETLSGEGTRSVFSKTSAYQRPRQDEFSVGLGVGECSHPSGKEAPLACETVYDRRFRSVTYLLFILHCPYLMHRSVTRRPPIRRGDQRLRFETLELRRLLAAELEPASLSGTTDRPIDIETDPRVLRWFHGPVLPGRPIPPIQAFAPAVDSFSADETPLADSNEDGGSDDDGPPESAPFSLDQTFLLHSKPLSNFTIYLDFDGHTTIGTSWNSSYGIDEIVHPNYWGDTNNDFSESRLELIQEIWQVVAEDFAPFDVNVTTEEPRDIGDLRDTGGEDTRWGVRVVMTKDTFADCRCGGHAFLGSFDDFQDEPSLVYNGGLGAGSETVSHEVGHQLNLRHDGNGGNEYYRGHGENSDDTGWGPIMGAPFSKRMTHWNNGDYFNASNTGQDDLAVITDAEVNFPYADDDHANESSGPSPLLEAGETNVTAFGIIERNDDVDWFRFETGGGAVSFNVDVLSYKANLDVWVGLFDSSGTFIADSNSRDDLSASLSAVELDAGEYLLKIDGVAWDSTYNPATDSFDEPSPPPYTVSNPLGYSDYGSLGQYRISGQIVATGDPTVSISADAAEINEGETATFTLTTSDASDTDVTVQIRPVRQSAAGLSAPWPATADDFGIDTTQVVSITGGSGTLSIPVVADAIVERDEQFEVVIIENGTYAVADRAAGMLVREVSTSYAVIAADADSIEGDTPGSTTHRFEINRLGREDVAHTIGWRRVASGENPADENDFAGAAEGTLEFDAGVTSQTLDIDIEGDLAVEPDETYAIELFVPQGQDFTIDSLQPSAPGTITDDESVVSFVSGAQYRLRQVSYSNGTFDNWAFDNFELTGTTILDDFDPDIDNSQWDEIIGATAQSTFPGTDGNALFFGLGTETRAATTIPAAPSPGSAVEFDLIFADSDGNGLNNPESGEDVVLEYSLDGTNWIEVQRFDEAEFTSWTPISVDLPSEATFAPTSLIEGDAGTNAETISVPRTGYLDKAITVAWQLTPTGDSPVDANDFVGGLPSGTIEFAIGESVAFVELDIAGDTDIEDDETFLITLSSNSGGPILNDQVIGRIVNDDFVEPEINLVGAGQLDIANDDLTPSVEDGTDFGLLPVEDGSLASVFTIENLGPLDLTVSGVTIEGDHPQDFAISQAPDGVVAPQGSTTFEVTFDPTAPGTRRATIVIANDDSDESPYRFGVAGLATDLAAEQIVLNGGDASRSQITSLLVTFNNVVEHQPLAEAFSIYQIGNRQFTPDFTITPADVDGKTQVTFDFVIDPGTGGAAGPQVFLDGFYELQIRSDAVVTTGSDPFPMYNDEFFGTENGAHDSTDAFFRFFGDADGDRDVDSVDLGQMGLTFLQTSDSDQYNRQLDADLDGDVDSRDMAEFRRRFQQTLTY